ncbi:MAG: kelch repeat-containing protein [Deltaproteobacteria bacterium]|nr:kelch repeat-containing protein [Deltaproteobacteria bacterium]
MGRAGLFALVVSLLAVPGGSALAAVGSVEWQLQTLTPELPSSREGIAAAWDPVEERVLLYGGLDASGYSNELWWWDPVLEAYHQVPTQAVAWPRARAFGRMTYDPVRENFLLFGGRDGLGVMGDPWTFDPTTRTWSPVTAGTLPLPREGQVMAWDPSTSSIVVHGGTNGAIELGDVQIWNGTQFLQSTPDGASPAAPTLRRHMGFWEPNSAELFVFGGEAGGAESAAMWAYSPTTRLWRQVTPATSPGARQDAVMAVDATGAWLYGGEVGGGLLDDLWYWEFSVGDWVLASGAVAPLPAARAAAGAALDPVVGSLMVFGGVTAAGRSSEILDWSLGGTIGYALPTPGPLGPLARTEAAMAYDATNDRFLLFGGDTQGGFPLARTWLLDATTWAWSDRPLRASAPPARRRASISTVGSDGTIVLHGGADAAGALLADTWRWSPATMTWTEIAIGTGPTARSGAAMAYERQSGRLILHGGLGAAGPLADTWEGDAAAGTWTPLSPGASPPAREGASMASLPTAGVLLHGGRDATQDLAETWRYDPGAGTWVGASPTLEPPGVFDGGMALDEWSYVPVHFGGATTFPTLTVRGPTHVFEAADWSLFSPSTPPPARAGHAMAAAPSRGGILIFGGHDGSTGLDDLWWGTIPSPDPVQLGTPALAPPVVVCPPTSATYDVQIEDADGRKILDPAKDSAGITATLLNLPASTQLIGSTLSGGTPLPAIAQVGTLVNGTVRFTLSASAPGSGELLVVPDPAGWPNLSVPVDLAAGAPSTAASTFFSSHPTVVTGLDVATLTFSPRDTCANLLGSGQTVTFTSVIGTIGSVTDNGDGSYETTLTTQGADCSSSSTRLEALVDGSVVSTLNVALACNVADVDPASPVTSPLSGRACASQGIFAEVTIVPQDNAGNALPPGRTIIVQENPPFLIAGQVREGVNPSGEPIYRIEVGSNRCSPTPVSVRLTVDGVLLSTIPQIRFVCEDVDPATIGLVAPSVAVPADGASPALLEVVALDECGNPAHSRPVSLESADPEVTIAFAPALVVSQDVVGDPADATAAFEARSALPGTFDVRATVDGRSAILRNALTFLESGGLALVHQSTTRRGVAGQVVSLRLELTNTYAGPLDAVIFEPRTAGLRVLSATEVIDRGDGTFEVGGMPVGSTVTVELEAVLQPGRAVASSEVDVRFRLRDSGLAGLAHSPKVQIEVLSSSTGGWECGTSGEAGAPALAALLALLGLSLIGRRRR